MSLERQDISSKTALKPRTQGILKRVLSTDRLQNKKVSIQVKSVSKGVFFVSVFFRNRTLSCIQKKQGSIINGRESKGRLFI